MKQFVIYDDDQSVIALIKKLNDKIDALFEKFSIDVPGKPKKDPEALTTKEVVRIFKVSARALYDWRKEGKLPFFTIGRRVYFNRIDIERVMGEDKEKKS